jgi:hypothetical protein
MPSYGIDTLYFTIPTVHRDRSEILPYLQQYIDPTLTHDHLIPVPGNGFYKKAFVVTSLAEDPAEFQPPYHGKTAELLRVSFDPTPKSAGKLFDNTTTSFQLHGELLDRINYYPVLAWISEAGGSVTRLDLFKDDFYHLLRCSEIFNLASLANYQDCIQSPLVRSYLDRYPGENSTYFGTKARGKQIHIYNKGLQTGEKFHHVRVELRLRGDNKFQTALVRKLVDGADEEELISSLLAKYITFKVPGSGRIHDRKQFDWWADFLATITTVRRCDFVPAAQIGRKNFERLNQEKRRLQAKLERLDARIAECTDFAFN